jgi:hypothetical protein
MTFGPSWRTESRVIWFNPLNRVLASSLPGRIQSPAPDLADAVEARDVLGAGVGSRSRFAASIRPQPAMSTEKKTRIARIVIVDVQETSSCVAEMHERRQRLSTCNRGFNLQAAHCVLRRYSRARALAGNLLNHGGSQTAFQSASCGRM